MSETSILLRVTSLESRAHIDDLAERYGWPVMIGEAPIAQGFVIEFEHGCLQLRDLSQKRMKPIFVDFLSGSMRHRRKFGLSRTQVFAKAIGVSSQLMGRGAGRTVIDATAGMGVDAFFLACLDCRVTAIERSPVIYELLMDGCQRALHDKEIGPWLPDYLRFVRADAVDYLLTLKPDQRPQVVYMDPMFPGTAGKSALPKKEMQVFRKLLGEDMSSVRLFEAARQVALERVVVKRPNEAPPVAPGVTHRFEGKTARYDMYAISARSGNGF